MSLSIGIVGLPNVGKSTLFNALLKRQAALAANYPFATIEPNVGIVDVPDDRLQKLAAFVQNDYGRMAGTREIPEKITPALIKFYDIAGLVKGASQGEGLGNEFLGHIREVDAIVQVVRAFSDENVIRAGATEPKTDIEIINTELILADLQSLDKRLPTFEQQAKTTRSKDDVAKTEVCQKLKEALDAGMLAREVTLSEEEKFLVRELNLLTLKPMIYVLNVDEGDLGKPFTQTLDISSQNQLQISAKIESELVAFDPEERKSYMEAAGITSTGLDQLIIKGYEILGLETFLTMGPKEVRAWTYEKGSKAPQAAGKIHTDFERGFISAEVINYEALVAVESLKKAKEQGLIRLEGKQYTMNDGDVVEFNFSV